MRIVVLLSLALASIVSPASAWEEYRYPDQGFAIQFPATPMIETGVYETLLGPELPSTVYSVAFENVLYKMTVVELIDRIEDGAGLVGEIAYTFDREGQILSHYYPRIGFDVKPVFGAGIVVDLSDGSRVRTSAFVTKSRFYRVDAMVLPARGDLDQAIPSRFDQTLRFLEAAP